MFSLVPYAAPERRFMKLFDEFDRELSRPDHEFGGMRTDIKETENGYLLEAELPGFEKSDISVDISDGVLTVSAKREENKETEKNGYVSRERRTGSFMRRFDLSGIDEDGITGEYKNGILALTLPKSKETVPETKKIAIE